MQIRTGLYTSTRLFVRIYRRGGKRGNNVEHATCCSLPVSNSQLAARERPNTPCVREFCGSIPYWLYYIVILQTENADQIQQWNMLTTRPGFSTLVLSVEYILLHFILVLDNIIVIADRPCSHACPLHINGFQTPFFNYQTTQTVTGPNDFM